MPPRQNNNPRTTVSDEAFIKLFEELGAAALGKRLGISERNAYKRRKNLELNHNMSLRAPNGEARGSDRIHFQSPEYPERHNLIVPNGQVLVASDFHFYPGEITPAYRAIIKFCKEGIEDIEPKAFIANGDVNDFPGISRHPARDWLDWEKRPKLVDEIEFGQEMMGGIVNVLRRSCVKLWTIGNHDERYEATIARVAPEFAKINGVHLKDHYPSWTGAMTVWINGEVVVMHYFRTGVHSNHNNSLWSGKTTVTGHTHALNVNRLDDYGYPKCIWGVNSGMVARPYGRQFAYMRGTPRNWRDGFVLLTFRDNELMWPEIINVVDDNHVTFRGKLHKV